MACSKSAADCCYLPKEFGYVCGAAVGSVFVNQFLAFRVMKARKQYDVKYPRLYHSEADHPFNCVQRGHQNFLEMQPVFLTLLMVAGTKFPKKAAICGVIYLAGRVIYAVGYGSGDPSKRMPGGLIAGLGGLLPLLGMSVITVLSTTGMCDKLGCSFK